jgi:transposase
MPRGGPMLSDGQWKKIEPLLPKLRKSKRGGRPWADRRQVREGILWIARSGARWQDLSAEYPSPATCWRRLRDWEEPGVWLKIWRAFLGELNSKGQLDWSEKFIDGSFASGKKGRWSRKDQAGQGYKVDGGGRWQGFSFGKASGIGLSGGSQACRNHARLDPRPQPPMLWPSAAKIAKADCRQGL